MVFVHARSSLLGISYTVLCHWRWKLSHDNCREASQLPQDKLLARRLAVHQTGNEEQRTPAPMPRSMAVPALTCMPQMHQYGRDTLWCFHQTNCSPWRTSTPSASARYVGSSCCTSPTMLSLSRNGNRRSSSTSCGVGHSSCTAVGHAVRAARKALTTG